MTATIYSYKDLIVWQKSINLVVHIYELTKKFPREEIYGLTSQMRRAAASIPANIAEGSSRGYLKEYISFLSIAYASGAELETFLIIAKKLNYLSTPEQTKITEQLNEVMRMLNVLIRRLKDKRSNA